MYDKSRFFIGGILADVFGPSFVAGSIEYFGIRYLYKTVCSFLINACLIGDEAEIVIPDVYKRQVYERSAYFLSRMMEGVVLERYVMDNTLWLVRAEVDVDLSLIHI